MVSSWALRKLIAGFMSRCSQKPEDMNELRLRQIQHFFEHYKDLEKGKWVKVEGWGGPDEAHNEIMTGVKLFQDAKA